jgi:photosystem II stability/assembly factor-like uncharacterized protein
MTGGNLKDVKFIGQKDWIIGDDDSARYKEVRVEKRIVAGIIAVIVSLSLAGVGHAGWVPQVSGVGFPLQGVSFADSLNGVVVGSGTSDTSLRTTNGGANWLIVTGPGGAYCVDLVTPQIGWAGGPGICKTTNGGITWTYQWNLDLIVGISFSDTLHGVAVSGTSARRVMWTTNGGNTWVQKTTATFDLYDVCMVDSNHAWVCGFDDTMPTLVTRDGGQTWTRQRNPPSGTTFLTGISFSDTLHGIAVGEDQPIQWTENGGVVWNFVYPGDGKQKTDVVMVDSLWAWMVGEPWPGGVLISRTTDGGRNWTVQNPGTTARLYSVSFTDRRNGWAVGTGGTIVHTSDGGVWVEEQAEGGRRKAEGGVTARPNPFTIHTVIPGHEAERFLLYDISGKLAGNYRGDRVGVDIGPGVYFLKETGRDNRPVRIVKVR